MVNNYDRIASTYDRLSRLVFFQAQTNAQKVQLPFIPPGSKILIVGGGTGWILEAIAKVPFSGLNITFVEISANMIALARKVDAGNNKVFFLQSAIEDQDFEHPFDVVITAFLFDNFGGPRAEQVFEKLHGTLKNGGLWLFSDFSETSTRPWQSVLLKLMYAFFRQIAQVEANSLFNTAPLFQKHGYRRVFHKLYYWKFIESSVYEKDQV